MNIILTEQQVNNLMNRLKNKIIGNKDNQQTPQISEKERYEKVKTELMKVDTDPNNMKSFGEGRSLDQNIAKEKAIFDANNKLKRKTGQHDLRYTSLLNEEIFYFETESGQMMYHVLVVQTM